MTQEEINEYLDTAFKMCDRYLAYFTVKEIFRIPYDIARCYCVFRKLFEGTAYKLMLKKYDEIYNNKVPAANFKVKVFK